jgi:hypothetical protein
MAVNAAAAYGSDVACLVDIDELCSGLDGIDLVRQDAYHRITTDDVLGPDGDGWGYDVRKILGMPMARALMIGPTISAALTRDDRILTADVALTPTTRPNGMDDILMEIHCHTAAGPFDLTTTISAIVAAELALAGATT